MARPNGRAWIAGLVAAACLSGCGIFGDDDDKPGPSEGDSSAAAEEAPAVDTTSGVFVGASGSGVVVAVVADPPGDDGNRAVTVFVSNGRSVSERFSATSDGSAFTATSSDGDADVDGELGDDGVSGTVALAQGDEVSYTATRAAGAAGLYFLDVSPRGKLTGATPSGVGATGVASLGSDGEGRLQLADGQKLRFGVTQRDQGGRLAPGEVVLIVTETGRVVGVGRSKGEGAGFRFRS